MLRADAVVSIAPIVLENFVVVKAEIGGDVPGGENAQILGIVSSLGFAFGSSDKDYTQSVLARVAVGVGINLELFNQLNLQAYLLLGFSPCCCFY